MTKNNNHLMVIKTRKYKDINLYLRFSMPFTNENRACLLLLSKLFSETSKKYPNKALMSKQRDMLYGINISCACKSRANIISFNIQYGFINPKFLSDITIDDYVTFIQETLFNTLIDNKKLVEAKRTVISSIKRKLDVPEKYAAERTNTIISSMYPNFEVYGLGQETLKCIKSLKVEDIKEIYQYILNKACLDIYICGDVNNTIVNKLCFMNTNNRKEVKIKYPHYTKKKISNSIEKKNINQSVLNLVFTTPYNKTHKDYFPFIVGNIFLGVLPTSLLFEDIREKQSLCYSINVIDYKCEGIVKVVTSYDANNTKLIVDGIHEEIKKIINKTFDVSKFEASKILFANIVESTHDDQNAYIDFLYENKLAGISYTLEQYAKKIMDVSIDDISRVFEKYTPLFLYVLKGKENE